MSDSSEMCVPYDESEEYQSDYDSENDSLIDEGIDPYKECDDIQEGYGIEQIEDEEQMDENDAQTDPQMLWRLIEDNGEVINEKFQRTERHAQFIIEHHFDNTTDLIDYKDAIDSAFENAIRPLLRDAQPNDLYSVCIEHEELNPSLYIGYHRVKNFDKKQFLDRLFKITQSNTKFLLGGVLKVRIVIVRQMIGGGGEGRNKRAVKSYKEYAKNAKSIITIKNENNACGYIAIAIGIP